jgi:hypothetical protein
MQFVYVDETRKVIIVTLDDGETIGSLTGPTVAFVPTDPDNTDFAAIVADGYRVNAARKPR